MEVLSEAVRQRVPHVASEDRQATRRDFLIIAGILGLALTVRFAGLGDKSFWSDEAYSALVASHSAREIVLLTAREDAHPPLYYLALAFWRQFFGSDDAGLRSLGATASVLTVCGIWWVGRRLGGSSVGAMAAFLTALSPFQVLAAQEARMYALLGLLLLVSWIALLLAVGGRPWGWVGYVVTSLLALYTHYFAALNLVGQGVFILVTAPRIRQAWLISQLAILLLYLPWMGRFLGTMLSGRAWPFLRLPLEVQTLTALLGLLSFGGHAFGFDGWFGGHVISPFAQCAVLVPFLVLAGVGLVSLRTHRQALWFVLGFLVIPLAVALGLSLRSNIIYPRYYSFVFPPFALLLAFAIHALSAKTPPPLNKLTVPVLGTGLLAFSLPVLLTVVMNPQYSVFDWRGAGKWLSAEAQPVDLIVIIPAYGRIPFSRYFHGPQEIVPVDPLELSEPPSSQHQTDAAAETYMRGRFRAYASQHEIVWVVTDDGVPESALVRLGTLLDGIYDLRSVIHFHAIRVYMAQRHPGLSRGPRVTARSTQPREATDASAHP